MSILHNTLTRIPPEHKINMSYLELGYENLENVGNNFKQVDGFKSQISVDMNNHNATYTMTTDEFFKINKHKFDIIYIDAGHTYEQVLLDYNNSVKALNEGGVIFIHDLFPPNIEFTIPGYCGDGFRLLSDLIILERDFLTYIPDMGLTQIFNNKEIDSYSNISYVDFVNLIANNKKTTADLEEWVVNFLKNI